ncbi:MAG: O-antigen polymerase [Acholeplasmataceae bacterium]
MKLYNNFLKISVIFIIFLVYKYFFLAPNYDFILFRWNSDYSSILILLFTVLSILILSILNSKFLNQKYLYFLFLLAIIFIFQILLTLLRYQDESLFNIIQSYHWIMVPFLYLIISKFIKYDKRNLLFLFKILISFSIFMESLILIQAVLFYFKGIIFLNFYSWEIGSLIYRNNSLYVLPAYYMLSFVFIFSFKFINRFPRIFVLNGLLYSAYLFYANSRMYLLNMFAALIISGLLYILKKKRTLLLPIFIVITTGFIIYIFNMNIFTDSSYLIRVDSYKYMLNQFINNPILGIGLLSDKIDIYSSIVHSNSGLVYYTDVGIIGILGQFGILFFLWYIGFLGSLIIIYLKTSKNQIYMLLLINFLIMTSVSSITFNYSGIIFIALTMSIFDYEERRINNGNICFNSHL